MLHQGAKYYMLRTSFQDKWFLAISDSLRTSITLICSTLGILIISGYGILWWKIFNIWRFSMVLPLLDFQVYKVNIYKYFCAKEKWIGHKACLYASGSTHGPWSVLTMGPFWRSFQLNWFFYGTFPNRRLMCFTQVLSYGGCIKDIAHIKSC